MAAAVPPLVAPDALDQALARADAYRVLAALFRDPDDPADDGQAPDTAVLLEAADVLGSPVDAARTAALRGLEDRARRAAEHRAVFGHVVAHGCPPYETEYGRPHLFAQSQELGDVRGFYEAFGVRPRAGGERPDHVACELEFLALLALKEALAIAGGDDERLARCRDAEASFLAAHAARWIPALAARIALAAPGGGYAAASGLAAALLAIHARVRQVAPDVLGPDDLLPLTEEPDGFSFPCGIDVEGGDLAPPGA